MWRFRRHHLYRECQVYFFFVNLKEFKIILIINKKIFILMIRIKLDALLANCWSRLSCGSWIRPCFCASYANKTCNKTPNDCEWQKQESKYISNKRYYCWRRGRICWSCWRTRQQIIQWFRHFWSGLLKPQVVDYFQIELKYKKQKCTGIMSNEADGTSWSSLNVNDISCDV